MNGLPELKHLYTVYSSDNPFYRCYDVYSLYKIEEKGEEREKKKKRKKHIGTLLWLLGILLASFKNELTHNYKVWTFTASHITLNSV